MSDSNMNRYPDDKDEIRPLSVRLRRRGLKVPWIVFRPACWLIRHQWWDMPEGLPYPTWKIHGDTVILNIYTKVKVCHRCHKKRLIEPDPPKICEVCEEETDCEYIAEGYEDVCCSDNDGLPPNKYCGNCQADYWAMMTDNAMDEYKDRQLGDTT